MKKRESLIFVISGPSGSGKTTLAENLLKDEDFKKRLVKPASFTTRPKRSGERNGSHYFFIKEKDFRAKLRAKKILEWTRYLGYYYATSKDAVEKQLARGKDILLCLDLKGMLAIRRLYPEKTVSIFILPPTLAILQERIAGRCKRTATEEIKKRLKMAQEELWAGDRYDYRLVNNNLAQAQKELKGIIVKETKPNF